MPALLDDGAVIRFLTQAGVGTRAELDELNRDAVANGQTLQDLLHARGRIDDTQSAAAWAASQGWGFHDLLAFPPSDEMLAMVTPGVARDLQIVPAALTSRTLTIASSNPSDMQIARRLQAIVRDRYVELVYASNEVIRLVIERSYSAAAEAQQLVDSDQISSDPERPPATADLGDLTASSNDEVVRLVTLTIEQAVRDRASDIHIEPGESGTVIRFRIDGVLQRKGRQSADIGTRMVNYVKVQAGMRSDDKRTGQDGPMEVQVNGRKITIRVVTLPGVYGEDVIMRLQTDMARTLDSLGFSPHNLTNFERAIAQPHGMVLVTGPTGSGKSTTLYSALRHVQTSARKIITVEDPVETKMPPGITQVQVHARAGWTFETALRSILRSDPDIILLGEIRDLVTAKTAVDAAMTGHLLLSTLHTNDAPSALDRLIELGVAPSMVGESLLQVLAQRLIRQVCSRCRVPDDSTLEQIHAAGFPQVQERPAQMFTQGRGCPQCNDSGYFGRLAVHEIMNVNTEIRSLARRRSTVGEMRDAALRNGMSGLREDGWFKIAQGQTSIAEVNRVVAAEI